MKYWNLAAEILGFLSACLLLEPALRQNLWLRRAWKLRNQIAGSPLKIAKIVSQSQLLTAKPAIWSAREQWSLTAGVVTLLASFLIKVIVVWLAP
jgi:hypothetical protein